MFNIIYRKGIPIIRLSLLAMLLVFTSGCFLSQEPADDVLDWDEGYDEAVLTATYDPKPYACKYMIELCYPGDEYPKGCQTSTRWPVQFDSDEKGNCTVYEDFSSYYSDGYDRVYVYVWPWYRDLIILNPFDPPRWLHSLIATWKACYPYCE